MIIKSNKETQETLETKILESSHHITFAKGGYTCVICKSSCLKKDKSLQQWLQTSCTCVPATTRPTKINSDAMHIGNAYIQHTHRLSTHRGLVSCKKCGSRAGSCLKHLAHPCVPPGKYGKMSLQAINSDRLPPNLDAWPSF